MERLHGRAPSAEEVPQLERTGHFLRESMRLYPGAHGMNRSTRDDEILGGYHIPAGSWVEVSVWGIHHSPAVWPEPEVFDPRALRRSGRTVPGWTSVRVDALRRRAARMYRHADRNAGDSDRDRRRPPVIRCWKRR